MDAEYSINKKGRNIQYVLSKSHQGVVRISGSALLSDVLLVFYRSVFHDKIIYNIYIYLI